MAETQLELTRSTHEDLERLVHILMEELEEIPKNPRDSIFQQHRVAIYLDKMKKSMHRLVDIYEDKDGSRANELNSISGQGPSLYTLFYDKLREVKDYHRRNPGLAADAPETHLYIDESTPPPQFMGEELYGRAIDVHRFHDIYCNLSNNRVDYFTYLDTFYKFSPDKELSGDQYKQYLTELYDYLCEFMFRSNPLIEFDDFLLQLEKEWTEKWNSGEFKGWETSSPTTTTTNDGREKMEIQVKKEKIPSSENSSNGNKKQRKRDRERREKDSKESTEKNQEKEKKEMEIEEKNPQITQVYCEPCKKTFAKFTVYNAHLSGKKHQKAAGILPKASLPKLSNEQYKEYYHIQFKINGIVLKYLLDHISNTKTNIEKKQARTLPEIEADLRAKEEELQKAEEEKEKEESESEDDEPEYKPQIENYPIGWDGKPIPYWLYKLHGLGVEYKCEICGNASYWGRKAFEKHFQEWRHAHGMRCLGIPNSRHFADITKINDAILLWEKLKSDNTRKGWKPEYEEEYEDKEGNVFNKKTYIDLQRQGLI